MPILTNKLNPKVNILDVVIERENLIHIAKFGLSLSITQYINLCQIFNDIHINNIMKMLDIEFNSYIFNCLENYQLSSTLVIYKILKVCCNKFHK